MSEKNRRSNYMKQGGIRYSAAWCMLLMFLVKIIYMSYKTGMQGMTYYVGADAVFLIMDIFLGMAVVPILKRMVYFQVNHGSYRNAVKVYRVISGLMTALAGIVAVVIIFFSTEISMLLFGTKLCSLLLKLMAVAILFRIPSFVLKGYVEGLSNPMPGIVSDVLTHATGLLFTILFQPVFAQYGRKVAALMRCDDYAYAYAVCSGALGLAVGGLAGFLFLFFVKTVFGKDIKVRMRGEESRKTDSTQDILWNFFGNYIKTALAGNIGVLLAIVLLIFYSHMPDKMQNGAGMLYAGVVIPVLPAGLLAMQIGTVFTRQLAPIMKQADFHHAKEKTAFFLKLLSYSLLPYACAVFALAPLVGTAFFDTESAELVSLIRIGALVAVLLFYSIFFRQMLAVLVKPYLRNIYAALLGVFGIVFIIILDKSGQGAEKGAACAYLLACLFYLLLICFVIFKKIRIYNKLVGSVVMPFAAAVISAAVSFGLFLLFSGKIPVWILLVVCAVLLYAIYAVAIVLLRVFEPHEWSGVPANGIPVAFAKLMGRY